jgi:ABC-type phosphate transport system substrate-binding protein
VRFAIYTAIVVLLLVFRVVPSLREKAPPLPAFAQTDTTLDIAGTSLAPELVGRMSAEYVAEYPNVTLSPREGGTTQALEDLVNGHADVAFLAREPNEAESRVIRDRGDSVSTFAVAIGGIAVVASEASDQGPMTVEELRSILRGDVRRRVIATDRNRGIWDVVAIQLGLDAGAVPDHVQWVVDERSVLEAISGDRSTREHPRASSRSLRGRGSLGPDPPVGRRGRLYRK